MKQTKLSKVLGEAKVYPVGTKVKITSPGLVHPAGIKGKTGVVIKLHTYDYRPAMVVKIGKQEVYRLRKSNVSLVSTSGGTQWSRQEVTNSLKTMRKGDNPNYWSGKAADIASDLAPAEFKALKKAYDDWRKAFDKLENKLKDERKNLE